MERITKTISIDGWIAEAVQELASKEKRSFTRQVEVLLETALGRGTDQPGEGDKAGLLGGKVR
jgi:hypothetical protein